MKRSGSIKNKKILILIPIICSAFYISENIAKSIPREHTKIQFQEKVSIDIQDIELNDPEIISELNNQSVIEIVTESKDNFTIESNNIKPNYSIHNAIVSYYTYLPQSTVHGTGITASGKKVSNTSLAIPRKDSLLKFGTKVEFDELAPKYMEDYQGQFLTRIADDTGNPKNIRKMNDGTYRLDVFCPRLTNETDEEYHKRVYGYGKTETKIKIYE